MADRRTLHKSKLDEFKRWCIDKNISTRAGRGPFQVLQVCHPIYGWGVIYDRIKAIEHYTADKKAIGIVRKFIESSRGIQ